MELDSGHQDRRVAQDVAHGEPSRLHLARLIMGTYREMPGLKLHLVQAVRLFGLHEATCRIVLEDLVAEGRLRRRADGQYVNAA